MASQPEHAISGDNFRATARLVRGTSQLITGGADGLHHFQSENDDATREETRPFAQAAPAAAAAYGQQRRPGIVRQGSARVMRETNAPTEIQERMQQDFMDLLLRNRCLITLIGGLLFGFFTTMFIIYILAAIAVVNYHDKPCDQPLKYYLLVHIMWFEIRRHIQSCLISQRSPVSIRRFALMVLLCDFPAWCLVGWGAYMVTNAPKCPKTNPELFYPTRRCIVFQICLAALILIGAIMSVFWFRRFYLYYVQLMAPNERGCVAAVHDLPKVPGESPELVEGGSGEPKERKACPICMETMSDKHVVVRTPCSHYFHEECLATWCQRHLDCPLCRQQIGEPDRDDDKQESGDALSSGSVSNPQFVGEP